MRKTTDNCNVISCGDLTKTTPLWLLPLVVERSSYTSRSMGHVITRTINNGHEWTSRPGQYDASYGERIGLLMSEQDIHRMQLRFLVMGLRRQEECVWVSCEIYSHEDIGFYTLRIPSAVLAFISSREGFGRSSGSSTMRSTLVCTRIIATHVVHHVKKHVTPPGLESHPKQNISLLRGVFPTGPPDGKRHARESNLVDDTIRPTTCQDEPLVRLQPRGMVAAPTDGLSILDGRLFSSWHFPLSLLCF